MRFFAPSSGTSGANYLHKLTHGPRLLDLEGRENLEIRGEKESVTRDPQLLDLEGKESESCRRSVVRKNGRLVAW
ncbi:hypothetical protein WN944_028384 [Citrus x changshan-huyou]|uniref:Uncharacterized protein n=1 Tax=Citrus x changshan-huyou TaxID=2935761 RepID=A0AAP0LLR6_9ROSI